MKKLTALAVAAACVLGSVKESRATVGIWAYGSPDSSYEYVRTLSGYSAELTAIGIIVIWTGVAFDMCCSGGGEATVGGDGHYYWRGGSWVAKCLSIAGLITADQTSDVSNQQMQDTFGALRTISPTEARAKFKLTQEKLSSWNQNAHEIEPMVQSVVQDVHTKMQEFAKNAIPTQEQITELQKHFADNYAAQFDRYSIETKSALGKILGSVMNSCQGQACKAAVQQQVVQQQ